MDDQLKPLGMDMAELMKVKAEIYPSLRPDTVMILHGWWQGCREQGFEDYPLSDGGANVNTI